MTLTLAEFENLNLYSNKNVEKMKEHIQLQRGNPRFDF
jgi:hypothetical protein